MIQALVPLSALFFGLALLLVGLGLQGMLLPVRATIESFSAIEIGLMGTAYFTGFVIGCLRTSYLVRAVGHIRVFTALVVIVSAIPLVHSIAVNPIAWLLLRAINGFCMAGVYMVIESWLNERTSNERRGGILAFYTSLNLTAITAGQLLLPLYDPHRFELFIISSILVSLAAVPVALSTSAAPAPLTRVSLRFMRIITQSPAGVAGCAAAGLISGAFWTLAPVFALNAGLSVTEVSLFMSVIVLGGALGQWPLGYLSDRHDRRKVLLGALAVACLLAVIMYLTAIFESELLFIPAFFYGAASFPIYAVAVSHLNDRISAEDFVETSSGLLLAHGLMSAIWPLVGGVVMRLTGSPSHFPFMPLALAGGAVFVYLRSRLPHVETEEHTASYVPMTANLAAVSLDPRAEEEEPEEPPLMSADGSA
jgi:MFS family permease